MAIAPARSRRVRLRKVTTGSVTYTYDDENQLTQAETDVSQTPVASRWKTAWTYDARGRMRIRQEYSFNTVSGWVLSTETRYLYDGRRVIQERNSSNVPLVTYVRGLDLGGSFEGAGGIGGMLSRTAHSGANGATLTHAFYHADANGNITKMIDNSQASVADYKYDPFGRTISSSGTLATANTYRFSSKELMGPSGFYYYGFRFYDPITQRWPNRDPLGEEGFLALLDAPVTSVAEDGPNGYLFVNNNSLSYLDFLGLALSDAQIANIVFNETRSLTGPDVDRARCNVAHAIKNGDKQQDEGRIPKRPVTAPTKAKVPDKEKPVHQKCMDAVKQCNDERKKGIDPTKGGIHFNLRGNSKRGPFQGHPLTSQCGPLNNSYTDGGLPSSGVYVNTYE